MDNVSFSKREPDNIQIQTVGKNVNTNHRDIQVRWLPLTELMWNRILFISIQNPHKTQGKKVQVRNSDEKVVRYSFLSQTHITSRGLGMTDG